MSTASASSSSEISLLCEAFSLMQLREVVSLCDQVTASNRYGLLDDFQGLDLVTNENGKESVFAIQYSMNDGTESAGRINWSNLLNSPGGGSPYGGDGFFLRSYGLYFGRVTEEK